MAYEKMDKQALATMARDYDRKSKPKVGFWGGVLAGLGSADKTALPNEEIHFLKEYEKPFAPLDSSMTISYYVKDSNMYSSTFGSIIDD